MIRYSEEHILIQDDYAGIRISKANDINMYEFIYADENEIFFKTEITKDVLEKLFKSLFEKREKVINLGLNSGLTTASISIRNMREKYRISIILGHSMFAFLLESETLIEFLQRIYEISQKWGIELE